MEKFRLNKQEIKFHLGLNILIALFITIASYVNIPYGNLKAYFVYFVHFIFLQFSVFGFVYVLSLFKSVFKVLFPILFLILVSMSFWVYTQDITIGEGMIQAIIEANIDIAIDVFSVQYVFYLVLSMLCLFFFLRKFKEDKKSSIKSPAFIIAIIGIITFFLVENYKLGAFKRRLPFNVYFGFVNYFSKPKLKLNKIGGSPFSEEKDLNVIFVLGESVRADHLSLNGYIRNTTPLLSNQKNILSFSKVYTPLTYTAISVPQILTNKSILDNNYKEAVSLYSVLNAAGFCTKWIGNQSLEKSYKEIVHTNDSVSIIDRFHSVLSFKKEKDLKLLDYFSINNITSLNKITTMHMIGSHWYYNNRFDERFLNFTPVTNSKYVGSLKASHIINSYDNTILYLDFFLNQLISELKKSTKKTILIYLSDHGENLGEEGKWLHAQEHSTSKNPAMLVWFSDKFRESYPQKVNKLISKKNDSISTDFLFHSILDIGGIQSYTFDKSKSLFN